MVKQCKGCGEDIISIKTGMGRVDVDAEPVWIVPGNGSAFYTIDGGILFGAQAGDANDDPDTKFVEAFMPHRWHCPNGGKKPRKRNRPSGYR